MSKQPLVVYWQNQASPYMVARYEALTRRGNVRIEGLYSRLRADDRAWSLSPEEWSFPHAFLPHRSPTRVVKVLRYLAKRRPEIFIAEHDRVDFFSALLAAPPLVGHTAARVLPTFAAWSRTNAAREAGKRVLFRSLSAATVSGPEAVAQVVKYGLPAERTFRMTQSIDVQHYASAREVAPETRQTERARLGLTGVVFVYAGRLWSGKGVDTLLEAFRVANEQEDISLLVVGTGVDEARYRAAAKDLPNVVFVGFRDTSEMPFTYGLADVLVLPTRGDPHGLVIEEGMSAGLAVISSSAAGHIRERVAEGVTGFVVPPDDVAQWANAMARLAQDPNLVRAMGKEAAQRTNGLGHERWAIDFEAFVDGAMRLPPRGRLRG